MSLSALLEDSERYNLVMRLDNAPKAGDSTIKFRAVPEGLAGEKILIDPEGNAEWATVSSIDNRVATLSTGLTYAHAIGTVCIRAELIGNRFVYGIGSAALTPGTIAANDSWSGDITISNDGAEDLSSADPVAIGCDSNLMLSCIVQGYVSNPATKTVKVVVFNPTASPVVIGATNFTAVVFSWS